MIRRVFYVHDAAGRILRSGVASRISPLFARAGETLVVLEPPPIPDDDEEPAPPPFTPPEVRGDRHYHDLATGEVADREPFAATVSPRELAAGAATTLTIPAEAVVVVQDESGEERIRKLFPPISDAFTFPDVGTWRLRARPTDPRWLPFETTIEVT